MERTLPYDVNIEDVLTELLEYMEDRQDVKDSDLGPSPNKEMRLATDISQALFQIERHKPENKKPKRDWVTGMPFGAKY